MIQNQEWVFLQCKQIVRFTKEVASFYVHATARKEMIKDLQQQLEKELDDVIEQTNKAFESAKKYEQEFRETADATIRQAYEVAFSSARKKFDQAQYKIDYSVQRITSNLTNEYMKYQEQLQDLQAKAKSQLDFINSITAELAKTKEEACEEFQERLKKDTAMEVTRANQKYNEVLIETSKQEESLISQYNEELSELKAKIQAERQSRIDKIATREAELAKQLDVISHEIDSITIQLDQLKLFMLNQSKEASNMIHTFDTNTNESTKKKLEEIVLQLAKLREDSASYEESFKKSMLIIDEEFRKAMNEKKTKINDEVRKWEDKYKELEENLNSAQSAEEAERKAILDGHELRQKELKKCHDEKLTSISKKEEELNALISQDEKTFAEKSSDLKSQFKNESEENKSTLDQMNASHLTLLSSIKEENDREIENLKEEIEKREGELNNAKESEETTISNLKDEIERIKESHKSKIDEINQQHSSAVNEMKTVQEDSFSKRKVALESEHLALLETQKAALLEEENNDRLELSQKEEELKEAREREINALRLQMETARLLEINKKKKEWADKIAGVKNEIDIRRRKKDDAEGFVAQEREKRQQKVDVLKAQLAAKDADWKKEKVRIDSEWAAKLTADQASHRSEEEKKLSEVNYITRDFDEKLEKLKSELSSKINRFAEETITRQKEQDAAIEKQKNEISELEKEIENASNMNIKRIADLQVMIGDLKRQTDSVIAGIRNDEEAEITRLQVILNGLRKTDAAEIKTLEEKLEDIRFSNNNRLSEVQHEFKAEEDRMTKEIEDKKSHDVEVVSEAHRQQQEELDAAEAVVRKLREEYDILIDNTEMKLAELERDYNTEMMKRKDEFDKRRLAMNEEITSAEREMKEKIAQLENELKEEDEKYANRGPRPEDEELIQKMQDELKMKEDAVKKLQEETQFFKQEIIRKENMYNRTFAKKPDLSIIGPMERKLEREAMISQLEGKLPPLPKQPNGITFPIPGSIESPRSS